MTSWYEGRVNSNIFTMDADEMELQTEFNFGSYRLNINTNFANVVIGLFS